MKLRTSIWGIAAGLALALSASAGTYTFQGKVALPPGLSPSDLTACLEHHEGRAETPPSPFLKEQPLGADGAFSFEADSTKAYTLYIRDAAGRILTGTPHLGKSRNFGTLTLKPDGEVAGTVMMPDGKPLADGTVQLSRKLDASCTHFLDSGTAKTDATGAFAFNKLTAGKYRLLVKSEQFTHPPHNFELTGDLNYCEIRLTKAAVISGRVLLTDGKPAAGVSVRADNKPAVTTDADGRYRIGGLGPDSYSLKAWTDALATEENATLDVTVKSADVSAADIVVAPVGSLVLTLKAEPAGRPLPDKLAISLTGKKERSSGNDFSSPVEKGDARFTKLPIGQYELSLDDEALGEVKTDVTIESGKESRAALTLPEVFSFKGTVVSDKGAPLAEARIMYSAMNRTRSSFYRHEQSDEDGTFTLSGLPKGEATLNIQMKDMVPLTEKVALSNNITGRRFTLSTGLTVTGRLVDASSAPIAGASISLSPKIEPGTRQSISFGSSRQTAKSEPDGSFALKGVGEGTFDIQVESEDAYGDFKPVTIAAGQTSLGQLTMQRGLAISGSVTEADGTPLAEARVFVSGMPAKKGSNRYISKNAETSADGSFRVGGLPEGSYEVRVTESGSYDDRMTLSNIKAGTDGLIVSLSKKNTLTVKVTGADGKPVVGAEIRAQRLNSRMGGFSSGRGDDLKTDEAGSCPLELRSGALYEIVAEKAPLLAARQKIDLTGDKTAPAEVALKMEEGMALAGLVVGPDGKGKAGVYVKVNELDAVKTDSQGRFKTEGVAPGGASIKVTTDADGETTLATERVPITREKPAGEVRITLPLLGSVSGIVKSKTGEPVADAMLFLQNTKRMMQEGAGYQGKTKADGRYLFDQVIPGSYMLMCMNTEEEAVRPQMGEVEVKAGETAVMDFPVASKSARIAGTIRIEGKPLEGASVHLLPMKDNAENMEMAMALFNETAETKAAGQFEIPFGGPGQYLLYVQKMERVEGEPPLEKLQYSSKIEIKAGQTNLAIEIAGSTIRGLVEDPAGKPCAEASIMLYPVGTGAEMQALLGRRLKTDEKGLFEAKYLAPETYRVMVSDAEETLVGQQDIKPDNGKTETRIRLQTGLKISGKVTVEGDQGNEMLLVMVVSDEGQPLRMDRVDADGTYTVTPNLMPGTYKVFCVHPTLSADMALLDLQKDATQDFVLKPGGSIQVELSGADKALAGKTIQVENAQGKPVFRLRTAAGMMGSMMGSAFLPPTDDKGKTLVQGLQAGDYVVRVDGTTASAKVKVTPLETVTAAIKIP